MPQQEAAPEGIAPLSPDEEAVVRSLRRVIYALPRAMDADLVREQRLPLTEYMALMHLSEAPERQMRMSDLAVACERSLSGMTRAVYRLQSDGLVQRVKDTQDARGWNAVLTDAGLARLRRRGRPIWPPYGVASSTTSTAWTSRRSPRPWQGSPPDATAPVVRSARAGR